MKHLIQACITLAIIVASMGYSSQAQSQNVNAAIASALKSGSSQGIARYFNSSVEININGKEEVYSKSQAEFVLKDFFDKNHCKDFKSEHERGSDKVKFTVGYLYTDKGQYRVTYMVKKVNNSELIYQLGITKE